MKPGALSLLAVVLAPAPAASGGSGPPLLHFAARQPMLKSVSPESGLMTVLTGGSLVGFSGNILLHVHPGSAPVVGEAIAIPAPTCANCSLGGTGAITLLPDGTVTNVNANSGTDIEYAQW